VKRTVGTLEYRTKTGAGDLTIFEVREGESDLRVAAERDYSREAAAALSRIRRGLKEFTAREPRFGSTFLPWFPAGAVPAPLRRMAEAAARFNLGPMAAVAGAVAEAVGQALPGTEAIVENGGDLFIRSARGRFVEILPGPGHPLAGKLTLAVPPAPGGIGIATSSGRWGRSISFGNADSVTVVADDPIWADAGATSLANRVAREDRARNPRTGDYLLEAGGVRGFLIVCGGTVHLRGRISLA